MLHWHDKVLDEKQLETTKSVLLHVSSDVRDTARAPHEIGGELHVRWSRCWRSRKATVPKEVLCGARSHKGGPPRDCRMFDIVLTEPLPAASVPSVPTPRFLGVEARWLQVGRVSVPNVVHSEVWRTSWGCGVDGVSIIGASPLIEETCVWEQGVVSQDCMFQWTRAPRSILLARDVLQDQHRPLVTLVTRVPALRPTAHS